MARLKSLLKVEGTLDDLSFYESKNGHIVRKKGGVKPGLIKNDPRFVRTRENMAEFTEISQAGKIIRTALRPVSFGSADIHYMGRLSKVLAEIKKFDLVSNRGERKIAIALESPETRKMFTGLMLKERAVLDLVYSGKYEFIKVAKKIQFNEFLIEKTMNLAQGATHCGFQFMWARISVANATSVNGFSNEHLIALGNKEVIPAFDLVAPEIDDSEGLLLIVLRINFYQKLNNKNYPLNSGDNNPVQIIYSE